MRTNPASFALSLAMGLIVLLIGFLALSTAGLVGVGPAGNEVTELPAPGTDQPISHDSTKMLAVAYKSVLPSDAAAVAAGDALFKNNCA